MSLVTLAFVLGLVLVNNDAFAESSVVSTASITVPIACTMTGTGTVHAATLNPGTYSGASGSEYQNGIGKTTLTAICNDDNGFSIYAVGYTGDSMTGNNTKLIGSSTQGMIDTKAYASGDTASNWSMKVTKVTDSTVSYNPANMSIQNSFDSWHAVPSSYTKVAQYHANTGSSATDTTLGAKVETTYAAYIATNQSADVYEGQVKYTLVHPYDEEPLDPQSAVAGCINYYANAANAVGAMGCQTATDGNTVQLFASNFSRDGYGFAGWSNKYDYATSTDADLEFFGPQEDIIVPTGTTANGLSLYAVWVKSAGNLQDTAKVTQLCGTNGIGGSLTPATYNDEGDSDESTWSITANLSSISALTDTRDNQTYAIAKLTDGNCWMIENLRLADKDSSNNDIILSSTNTNNPSLPLTNIYDSSTTSNHLSPTSSVAYNATTAPEGWCATNSSACDDQSRLRTDNTTNRVTFATTSTSMSNPNASFYSYGNYYNWYSATAGHGKYGSSYGSGYTAPGDICPAGWHLPTGTGSGEFGILSNSLGGYKNASDVAQRMTSSTSPTVTIMLKRLRHFPSNLLYSGNVSGASLLSRGNYGHFWSSTANNSSDAYYLGFYSSTVYPGTGGTNKYIGRTVRCIASPSA